MNNCSICNELRHNNRTCEKTEQLENERDEDSEEELKIVNNFPFKTMKKTTN